MADQCWSRLPRDLLVLILERLSLVDHLSFEAVCVSWSLAVRDRHSRPTPQSPWLLHTLSSSSSSVRFLSLSDNKKKKKKKLYITSPTISSRLRHKLCIGSSPNGWLVTLDPTATVSLINPLTGSHIPLPPITAISKAVVSSSTVAAIHGVTRLSYTKPGDTQWSPLDSPHPFHDLIFRDGLLYTLSHTGLIESWDLDSPSPEATTVVGATPGERWLRREGNHFHKYLVGVGGDLVQVWRERQFTVDEQRIITRFRVFTLNEKRSRWVGSKGLPDHAVFVGHNSSFSLPVREFPELRPNCIYFTDDLLEDVYGGPKQALDLGVYDLVDGSIDRFYMPELLFDWPPPIWFMPSLQ